MIKQNTIFIPLSAIKPNSANPRTLRDAGFMRLKKSLAQFPKMLSVRGLALTKEGKGWVTIGGNQRYRCLCDLAKEIDEPGFCATYETTDENVEILRGYFQTGIPAHDCTGFTDEEVRRFTVVDNVPAGEWDTDALANGWDIDELTMWGLPDWVVGGVDIDSTTPIEVTEEMNEAVDMPDTTEIQAGDIFEIGPHRLLCGDSASIEEIEILMNGRKAEMVFTDPPYGVSYVGKTKDALKIENDNVSKADLETLVKKWFDGVEYATIEGAYILATVPAGQLNLVFAIDFNNRGWLRQQMVWNKSSMVLGHSEYHYKHEPILFGWKGGGNRHKNTDRTKTTVWDFGKPNANKEHPTMKPVEMWTYGICNHTDKGWLIYEPFLGSGTTMVAAQHTGRICYGMEIDPKYCQVTIDRMSRLYPELEIKKNGEPYPVKNP